MAMVTVGPVAVRLRSTGISRQRAAAATLQVFTVAEGQVVRAGPFPARMNAVPKLVATRSLTGTSAWANSRVIDGDLADAVRRERRDVSITGSLSILRALRAADLIDEYGLLTFPTILGAGERFFPDGPPAYLECLSAERPAPPSSHGMRGQHDDGLLPGGVRGAPEAFDRHYRDVTSCSSATCRGCAGTRGPWRRGPPRRALPPDR
jgi:dihydrofolate reductase